LANDLTAYQQQYGTVGGGFFGSGQAANQQLGQSGYNLQNYATANGGLNQNAFNGYNAQNAQAANINASGGQPYSNAQLGLMAQLQGQANGTGGPSQADLQLQQGTQAALASTLASTAGARGQQNAGAAAKMAQENQAAQTQGAAAQAASQRASEQVGAEQQLAGLTGQGINQATQQAGLTQQAALANQQAQNAAAQFGAESQQNYQNLANQNWQFGTGLNAQQNNAYNQAIYGLVSGNQASQNQLANSEITDWASPQGINSLAQAGNALSSDEDVKSNIENSNSDMRAFLASLSNSGGMSSGGAMPLINTPEGANIAKKAPTEQPKEESDPFPNTGGMASGADADTAGANLGATDLPGASGIGEGGMGGAADLSGAGGADLGGAAAGEGGAMTAGLGGEAAGGAAAAGGASDLGMLALAAAKGLKNKSKHSVKTMVGEKGGEAVDVPKGPLPLMHMGGSGGSGGGAPAPSMNMQNYMQGSTVLPGTIQTLQDTSDTAPAMPGMAGGGMNKTHGMMRTMVGEEGPEVIDLPPGGRVYPHEDPRTQMLLDQMPQTHSYTYKNPNARGEAPGTHYGPMAQEIEKGGPIGRSLVKPTGPGGTKQVDTARLSLALASGMGMLNSKINSLEMSMAELQKMKTKKRRA
jgi:hypothetical protein